MSDPSHNLKHNNKINGLKKKKVLIQHHFGIMTLVEFLHYGLFNTSGVVFIPLLYSIGVTIKVFFSVQKLFLHCCKKSKLDKDNSNIYLTNGQRGYF